MDLIFLVHLEVGEIISEDNGEDGDIFWDCTHVKFGRAGRIIAVDHFWDGESGKTKTKLIRDDFGLPAQFAERLARAVRRTCGYELLEISETVDSLCDLRSLINRIAYYSEAQSVLRKIQMVLADTETRSAT